MPADPIQPGPPPALFASQASAALALGAVAALGHATAWLELLTWPGGPRPDVNALHQAYNGLILLLVVPGVLAVNGAARGRAALSAPDERPAALVGLCLSAAVMAGTVVLGLLLELLG